MSRSAVRWSRRLAAPLLAFFLLAGGGLSAQPRAVRILVPMTTSSVPLLALDGSQVAGLRLETRFYASHAQALALLLRGEADLLLTGTSQGWENHLGGGPLMLIDNGVWGVSSLVGRDASIRTIADLKGKRIALPFPGAPLDFQTRYLLKRSGLDPDRDVQLSYSPLPQIVARLVQGQLDAAPLPEPLATGLVRQQGFLRLIEFSELWARTHDGDGRSPQVGLFATRDFCRREGTLIRRVVEAWRAASETAAGDAAQLAARFAAGLSTPPEVLEEAIRRTLYWVPPMAENHARVRAYYQEVHEFLPGSPPPLGEDFFCSPE